MQIAGAGGYNFSARCTTPTSSGDLHYRSRATTEDWALYTPSATAPWSCVVFVLVSGGKERDREPVTGFENHSVGNLDGRVQRRAWDSLR